MSVEEREHPSRRRFLGTAGAAAAGLVLSPLSRPREGRASPRPASSPLLIGIIGSGRQGGSLGLLFARAGHQVLFSSRHPDELSDLVRQAGNGARAGMPDEAARFGEIVLIAVPYGALPQVGKDYAPLMQGKAVIDCGNPREDRDGPMARDAIQKGTGVASAEYLPGVRLVRSFSALSYITVRRENHRSGDWVGIPLAGDDANALAATERLIHDSGFDPVLVGGLQRARLFDRGTPVYVKGMTADELRAALDIRP